MGKGIGGGVVIIDGGERVGEILVLLLVSLLVVLLEGWGKELSEGDAIGEEETLMEAESAKAK